MDNLHDDSNYGTNQRLVLNNIEKLGFLFLAFFLAKYTLSLFLKYQCLFTQLTFKQNKQKNKNKLTNKQCKRPNYKEIYYIYYRNLCIIFKKEKKPLSDWEKSRKKKIITD